MGGKGLEFDTFKRREPSGDSGGMGITQYAQPVEAILALDLIAIDNSDDGCVFPYCVPDLSAEEWDIIVRQRSHPLPEWIRAIKEQPA